MFGVQRTVNKVNSAGGSLEGDGAVYEVVGGVMVVLQGEEGLAIGIRNEIKMDGEEQEGEIKEEVGERREELWRFNLEAQTKTVGGSRMNEAGEEGKGELSTSDFSPPSPSASLFCWMVGRSCFGRRRREETQVEHQFRRRHKGGVSRGGGGAPGELAAWKPGRGRHRF